MTTGFLPELFRKWNDKGASHLVTIITFARIHFSDEEVEYLERNDLGLGLIKDYSGRWCKDFFRVIVDFERRTDWNLALAEIKRRLERSEMEILLEFHLMLLNQKHPNTREKRRIVGKWSFVSDLPQIDLVGIDHRRTRVTSLKRSMSRSTPSMSTTSIATSHVPA